jgi:predicted Zn-dependent protease
MKIIWVFILSLLVLSCSNNPITGRKQLMLVSDEQMDSMSLGEYRQFLQENKLKVITTGTDVNLVKNVGTRIASAVTLYMASVGLSDRMKNYNWEFNLVKDSVANAWCMPGGKVVVYTGLLPITQNETALAVVLGHEISHAIANHGNERMSQQMLEQLGFSALDAAMANKPEQTRNIFEGAIGMGTELGIMLPFNRKQESEADRMGLIFMAMADYDPTEALNFWKRMMEKSKGQQPPEFLSTHPSDERRIADIQNKYLPEALKYYKRH